MRIRASIRSGRSGTYSVASLSVSNHARGKTKIIFLTRFVLHVHNHGRDILLLKSLTATGSPGILAQECDIGPKTHLGGKQKQWSANNWKRACGVSWRITSKGA